VWTNYGLVQVNHNLGDFMTTGAVPGKNIWGAWPLIIWEATTAK